MSVVPPDGEMGENAVGAPQQSFDESADAGKRLRDSNKESDCDVGEARGVRLVNVNELRGDNAESTCLRPLNMCDLGSCEVCWYNPDHPRFKKP
ncbi:MAG: hypothetical protein A2289_17610 [Deltaproteobacteria bacterium RIFOXYA12_FULL_58_15]|nr:MAG: hypothetical protein A2289_17610 [Deltaproteobacteria bacterium RIFOXYA12_FULL_58_15]OGR11921.1 MAG: hypothetical protein A2341_19340 [Deltaproteobacteria bacterium RIFOXYB12_FULL_58_9]